MAIPHAASGEHIVLLLGNELAAAQTTVLIKTDALEVIRLVVQKGKEIPLHQAPGPITVQCLEGRVAFTAHNATRELRAGEFLYLAADEPHALQGIENASLLLTIILK